MALTAPALRAIVARHGRWLWHATDEDCAAGIVVHGLRPGVEGNGAGPTIYVYFSSRDIATQCRGDEAFVLVDLLALDPGRFEPDPDGLLRADMVVEDGLLGIGADGQPALRERDAVRWVTKDYYFLREPFSCEATVAVFERYRSFAYRGIVPAAALKPAQSARP